MAAAPPAADTPKGTASGTCEITLPSGKVDDNLFQGYIVEKDMFQPDMATIILNNQNDKFSPEKIGGDVEIKAGSSAGTSIFKGQIVGLEPMFKGDKNTKIIIRCMGKLHLLLRKRKSRTWQECGDADVLKAVVSDANLTLEFKHDDAASLKYKHVYQHNQTDLEFLRVRAARIGAHIWADDTKIFVKKPDLGEVSGLKLSVDGSGGGQLQQFMPRLSSTQIVKSVKVRGWNPETKELIEGKADVVNSALGSESGSAGSGALGGEETFTVDHPIWSTEEANVLAKARMRDLSLTYITGEAQVHGINDQAKLGTSVEIEANASGASDPFNGRYYIMGITYKNVPTAGGGAGGGASGSKDTSHTILRLARDAQKS